MKLIKKILFLAGTGFILFGCGQTYEMKKGPLMTKWADQVNSLNPWPEYPRPQLARTEWMNLNGIWQFQVGNEFDEVPFGKKLKREILVPYPVESAISGIMENHDRVWYRRMFKIREDWKNKQIKLNFEAVDWESEVYINGKSIGIHKGGYDPFSYNITEYLNKTGEQEIIVRVFDPTEFGGQPRGKQATKGVSIMYTPCTGIWQTVWLEAVSKTNIEDIKITPDIDNTLLKLLVNAQGNSEDVQLKVEILGEGKTVQTGEGIIGKEMQIEIPDQKLWTPDHPFLYDLKISLIQNNAIVDEVSSYFGMRKISVEKVDGFPKLMLNNEFVFHLGALDQGYWPDGIYTPPTEEAMKYDMEVQKQLGYNTIRKHLKVESKRWYYWADKMGFLVWQDMPSGQSYGGVNADPQAFIHELKRMIESHWNSTSIVMWVIFNENCGQEIIHKTYPVPKIIKMVKDLDPTRIVNEASGHDWYGSGDIADSHTYPEPRVRKGKPNQAIVSGEFGATKYKIEGHTWGGDNGIEVDTEEEFLKRYRKYAEKAAWLKTLKGLCGAVYTQITDVETELNGILTYDRDTFKTNIENLRPHNLNAIQKSLTYIDILPTSEKKNQLWKCVFKKPTEDWFKPNFDDSAWETLKAPFAANMTPGIRIGTYWATSGVWMRKEFQLEALAKEELENLRLRIYHDDECEVYINGVQAISLKGYTGYLYYPINEEAVKAFKPNNKNIIAAHCHQNEKGQGVDVGIVLKELE